MKNITLTKSASWIRDILRDPGVLFPMAYATLCTSSSGPFMIAGITMSILMGGLNLHQSGRLGSISRAINKLTAGTPLEKPLKNPLLTTSFSGWTLMGLGAVGLASTLAFGLGPVLYGSAVPLGNQIFVATATGLLGYSLKRKATELQALPISGQVPDVQTAFRRTAANLNRSETPLAGVAVISHILTLGPAAIYTVPLVAVSLAASLAASGNPQKPAIKPLKKVKLSDSAFSRAALSTAGLAAGAAGLALGNIWLGASNLLASRGNYRLFRMTMEADKKAIPDLSSPAPS